MNGACIQLHITERNILTLHTLALFSIVSCIQISSKECLKVWVGDLNKELSFLFARQCWIRDNNCPTLSQCLLAIKQLKRRQLDTVVSH